MNKKKTNSEFEKLQFNLLVITFYFIFIQK
jgi:hypothetical protein